MNSKPAMEHDPDNHASNEDIVDEMFKVMKGQEKTNDAEEAHIQQLELVEYIRTVVKTRPRRKFTNDELSAILLILEYWKCGHCNKELTRLDHAVSTCQHKLCRDCFTAFRSLPPYESPDMCVGCKLSYLPGTF
jgi:hypothetical protein